MKTKQMWGMFGVAFVATMLLRLYQTFTYTDFSTSLETGGDLAITITFALLLVFAIIVLVYCASEKKAPVEYTIKTNYFSGIFSAFAGVFLVAYAINYYINYFSQSTSTTVNINIIVGAICGIVFLLMAMSSFMGKNILEKLPLILLIPIVWICVRLVIYTFIDYTLVTSSSLTIMTSIALIFMLVYLFTYVKLISHQQTKNTYKRLFAIGMITVITVLAYAIPTIIIWVSSKGENTTVTLMPALCDLMIALYIFSTLVEITAELSKNVVPVIETNTAVANNSGHDQPKEGFEIFDEIKESSRAQRVQTQSSGRLTHTITSNTSYFDKLVDVPIKTDSNTGEVANNDLHAANQVVREETVTIDKGAIQAALKEQKKTTSKSQPPKRNIDISPVDKPSDESISMSQIDKLINEIMND